MVNPVEVIGGARRRIALIAALRAGLYLPLPAVTLLVIGFALGQLGASTWGRWGYVLDSAVATSVRTGLVLAGLVLLLTGAVFALRAYRTANDFVGAAERVDTVVNGHQEILTLAALADPARIEEVRPMRTSLFPVLWRRAIGMLGNFEARQAFRFEIGAPLGRSSALTLGAVILLGVAMLVLVRPPTPEEAQAQRLREIASEIEKSPSQSAKSLAQKVLAAAAALENPKLPPQEKLEQVTAAMKELEKYSSAKAETSARGGSGGSGGNGNSGKGEGKGSGEGKGEGKGKGPGPGTNQGPKSGKDQIAELRNELSKAEARIETESASGGKPEPKPSNEEKASNAPKAGEKPDQRGPGKQELARIEALMPGAGEQPRAGGKPKQEKNQKGAKGDTHLGEFPAPEAFERFYKLGEKGPPLELKDARYVVFRLPSEVSGGGGGKTVLDTSQPSATTPYANIPLKEQRMEAAPEERQLVPPRYRDLIH